MHVYAYVYRELKSTCQGLDAPALIRTAHCHYRMNKHDLYTTIQSAHTCTGFRTFRYLNKYLSKHMLFFRLFT